MYLVTIAYLVLYNIYTYHVKKKSVVIDNKQFSQSRSRDVRTENIKTMVFFFHNILHFLVDNYNSHLPKAPGV